MQWEMLGKRTKHLPPCSRGKMMRWKGVWKYLVHFSHFCREKKVGKSLCISPFCLWEISEEKFLNLPMEITETCFMFLPGKKHIGNYLRISLEKTVVLSCPVMFCHVRLSYHVLFFCPVTSCPSVSSRPVPLSCPCHVCHVPSRPVLLSSVLSCHVYPTYKIYYLNRIHLESAITF